ncbi:MAG: hypothetical protein Q9227_003874 [Pyrenula ochraceoflavens]
MPPWSFYACFLVDVIALISAEPLEADQSHWVRRRASNAKSPRAASTSHPSVPSAPDACSSDQEDAAGDAVSAAKAWLKASIARLDPNTFANNNHDIEGHPHDIYYSSFFNGEDLMPTDYGWVTAISDTHNAVLQTLEQAKWRCPDQDDICDPGVWDDIYYNPDDGHFTLCKGWFDDDKYLPAATVEEQCKGDNAKLYSVSDVRETKPQTIIGALIVGPKLPKTGMQDLKVGGQTLTCDNDKNHCQHGTSGKWYDPVSASIQDITHNAEIPAELELPKGDYRLPDDDNLCPPPDPTRKKGDHYPNRCAMFNRYSHLDYITGMLGLQPCSQRRPTSRPNVTEIPTIPPKRARFLSKPVIPETSGQKTVIAREPVSVEAVILMPLLGEKLRRLEAIRAHVRA